MTDKTWRFLLAAALLLAALYLVGRRDPAGPLPTTAAHSDLVDNASCVPCHGEEGPSPLSPSHPPKRDCLYCHRR